jgi:NAD(P)-dependent dehydrogenase (short-subunit alcohol dehydrogenase family)
MKETILITGVSRGFGHALARRYLEQGHTVHGCSRGACDLGKAFPDTFHHRRIDLADADAGQQAVDDWFAGLDGFDLVILNAGVLSEIRDLRATPLGVLRDSMEVNVWANKWLLDAVLALPRKPRQVVGISSGAAVSGSRGWNGYAVSKAAFNMLIALYAAEEPEVHFTALAPGLIDTAMQDYLCGIEDDAPFSTVRRLKQARHTEAMPSADEAARRIQPLIPRLTRYDSGAFLDVRELED